MSSFTIGQQPPGPADRPTFARLIYELQELGFEPTPEFTQPGHTVYTATDSPVHVTVIDEPGRRTVWVAGMCGGNIPWSVEWSAHTPHAVQLIALYAALNDDPQAALHGAACAIGVHAPTASADPTNAAG